MRNSDKKQFLNDAIDLARNLEEKTDKFAEVQIGWYDYQGIDLPVTIMINHHDSWFGDFENRDCWNAEVLRNNCGKLTLVENPYLVLNDLIDLCLD